MTTGRINQVTIVRRGWPPDAYFSAGEIFQVTGRRPLGARRSQRFRPEPSAPLAAIRFPPLRSPGHPSAAPRPVRGPCGLGAPGGGLAAQRRPLRRQLRVVASRCSVVGLAIGQSPTEPIQRRLGGVPPAAHRATPVRRTADAAGFVGVERHCESPRERDRSLQACSRGHAVTFCKIRYRCLRFAGGPAAVARCSLSASSVFQPLCPPLIYPPTCFWGGPRHAGLAGHFSNSAKFICMAKQKNRLTTTKLPHQPARIRAVRPGVLEGTQGGRPHPSPPPPARGGLVVKVQGRSRVGPAVQERCWARGRVAAEAVAALGQLWACLSQCCLLVYALLFYCSAASFSSSSPSLCL